MAYNQLTHKKNKQKKNKKTNALEKYISALTPPCICVKKYKLTPGERPQKSTASGKCGNTTPTLIVLFFGGMSFALFSPRLVASRAAFHSAPLQTSLVLWRHMQRCAFASSASASFSSSSSSTASTTISATCAALQPAPPPPMSLRSMTTALPVRRPTLTASLFGSCFSGGSFSSIAERVSHRQRYATSTRDDRSNGEKSAAAAPRDAAAKGEPTLPKADADATVVDGLKEDSAIAQLLLKYPALQRVWSIAKKSKAGQAAIKYGPAFVVVYVLVNWATIFALTGILLLPSMRAFNLTQIMIDWGLGEYLKLANLNNLPRAVHALFSAWVLNHLFGVVQLPFSYGFYDFFMIYKKLTLFNF